MIHLTMVRGHPHCGYKFKHEDSESLDSTGYIQNVTCPDCRAWISGTGYDERNFCGLWYRPVPEPSWARTFEVARVGRRNPRTGIPWSDIEVIRLCDHIRTHEIVRAAWIEYDDDKLCCNIAVTKPERRSRVRALVQKSLFKVLSPCTVLALWE